MALIRSRDELANLTWHRFGSSLNGHVHFRVCVVSGVFEEVAGQGDADADVQSSPPGIAFHPASGIDAAAAAQVQTDLRRRIEPNTPDVSQIGLWPNKSLP